MNYNTGAGASPGWRMIYCSLEGGSHFLAAMTRREQLSYESRSDTKLRSVLFGYFNVMKFITNFVIRTTQTIKFCSLLTSQPMKNYELELLNLIQLTWD
jgi:hypothetical protein